MSIEATSAESLLAEHAERVEAYLRDELPRVCGFLDAPPGIVEAINYSVFAGGKRIRPALVLESARCCCGSVTAALPAAAAVELIHTFSLVHDDLPAMDDDDLRRGRPTLHKAFDEATAILAGDAMTTLAFEVLVTACEPAVGASLVRELAHAAGPVGMVGGQLLDIAAEGRQLDLEALRDVHRRKTGALITAACRMGGIAARATPTSLEALTVYGRHIGLVFQIADDVLDVVATPEAMGKATQKDAAAGKNTYPALLGLDAARELAQQHVAAAIKAVAPLEPAAENLRLLAQFALSRAS